MEKIYEIQRIKQVVQEVELKKYIVRSPEDGADIAYDFIGEDDREVFFVMCLNTKNHVVAIHRAHVGSLNASIVHPRDVFKVSILNNAASIVCAHQHPSGDPIPSQEDIHVTRRLVDAGKMIGIEILDHVIVGEKRDNKVRFTSLKEKGYIS